MLLPKANTSGKCQASPGSLMSSGIISEHTSKLRIKPEKMLRQSTKEHDDSMCGSERKLCHARSGCLGSVFDPSDDVNLGSRSFD